MEFARETKASKRPKGTERILPLISLTAPQPTTAAARHKTLPLLSFLLLFVLRVFLLLLLLLLLMCMLLALTLLFIFTGDIVMLPIWGRELSAAVLPMLLSLLLLLLGLSLLPLRLFPSPLRLSRRVVMSLAATSRKLGCIRTSSLGRIEAPGFTFYDSGLNANHNCYFLILTFCCSSSSSSPAAAASESNARCPGAGIRGALGAPCWGPTLENRGFR